MFYDYNKQKKNTIHNNVYININIYVFNKY